MVLVGTVWDTPADADEFARALTPDDGLEWKVEGDAVAILAGDPGKKGRRLLNNMLAALAD